MYSLIVTPKLNDIDPQAWLADVLARIAEHPVQSSTNSCPGTGRRIRCAVNWRHDRSIARLKSRSATSDKVLRRLKCHFPSAPIRLHQGAAGRSRLDRRSSRIGRAASAGIPNPDWGDGPLDARKRPSPA